MASIVWHSNIQIFHATLIICMNFVWNFQNFTAAAAILLYKILHESWEMFTARLQLTGAIKILPWIIYSSDLK